MLHELIVLGEKYNQLRDKLVAETGMFLPDYSSDLCFCEDPDVIMDRYAGAELKHFYIVDIVTDTENLHGSPYEVDFGALPPSDVHVNVSIRKWNSDEWYSEYRLFKSTLDNGSRQYGSYIAIAPCFCVSVPRKNSKKNVPVLLHSAVETMLRIYGYAPVVSNSNRAKKHIQDTAYHIAQQACQQIQQKVEELGSSQKEKDKEIVIVAVCINGVPPMRNPVFRNRFGTVFRMYLKAQQVGKQLVEQANALWRDDAPKPVKRRRKRGEYICTECGTCIAPDEAYDKVYRIFKIYSTDKVGVLPNLNRNTSWKRHVLCEECLRHYVTGLRVVEKLLGYRTGPCEVDGKKKVCTVEWLLPRFEFATDDTWTVLLESMFDVVQMWRQNSGYYTGNSYVQSIADTNRFAIRIPACFDIVTIKHKDYGRSEIVYRRVPYVHSSALEKLWSCQYTVLATVKRVYESILSNRMPCYLSLGVESMFQKLRTGYVPLGSDNDGVKVRTGIRDSDYSVILDALYHNRPLSDRFVSRVVADAFEKYRRMFYLYCITDDDKLKWRVLHTAFYLMVHAELLYAYKKGGVPMQEKVKEVRKAYIKACEAVLGVDITSCEHEDEVFIFVYANTANGDNPAVDVPSDDVADEQTDEKAKKDKRASIRNMCRELKVIHDILFDEDFPLHQIDNKYKLALFLMGAVTGQIAWRQKHAKSKNGESQDGIITVPVLKKIRDFKIAGNVENVFRMLTNYLYGHGIGRYGTSNAILMNIASYLFACSTPEEVKDTYEDVYFALGLSVGSALVTRARHLSREQTRQTSDVQFDEGIQDDSDATSEISLSHD